MTAGVQRFLKPDGFAIHAVDHVHRGEEDIEHLAKLRLMVASFGLSSEELDRLLEGMALDAENTTSRPRATTDGGVACRTTSFRCVSASASNSSVRREL